MRIGLSACALCGCMVSAGSCRTENSPTEAAASKDRPWFVEIGEAAGLEFAHETGSSGKFLFPEIMGGGCAMFDFDNDGDLDIYLTTGHDLLPQLEGAGPGNRLFRQEADGRFVDVSESSGLNDRGYGMGVAIGDVDNDGDVDVYVSNYGPDQLYRNLGDGRFENVTAAAGIAVSGWSTSAVFLDYDGDGFLDLYVTRYVEVNSLKQCSDGLGRPDYCSPHAFYPIHDVLLHNNGDGSFADVSRSAGIASVSAAGLGVVCEDFNDDGRMDIYVANDAFPNNMWINKGDGTFRNDAVILGTALNLNGRPEAGMGVVAADFDNDADVDLFMTHLRHESNTLYLNLGGGSGFDDATAVKGLGESSIPFTGFGTAAFDVELDGDLDLFVANGAVVRRTPFPQAVVSPPWNDYAEPNLFYINDGHGRFSESSGGSMAAICSPAEVSRGVAAGDIDSDGDIDLLVVNLQGAARLYRNDAPRRGHWLGVRAIDPKLGRDAIGARITLAAAGGKRIRTIGAGSSYLSSRDLRAHFGLGDWTQVDGIEVRWPDGVRETFAPPSLDQYITLERGSGSVTR